MDEIKDEIELKSELEDKIVDDEIKEEHEDEEDEEALPHSEFLDIFEEGLALMVQDPLLCDLPIQVYMQSRGCFKMIIHPEIKLFRLINIYRCRRLSFFQ